jgi:cytochrome c553
MKKLAFLTLLSVVFFSCQKKATQPEPVHETKASCSDTTVQKKEGFEMYQMSEMAALMEQMYAENKALKANILAKKPIGAFPEYYNRILTATFTDATDNDELFKTNADLYLKAQKKTYSGKGDAKQNYNKGIDACITCHETKCGGPIPRIKKLYIK